MVEAWVKRVKDVGNEEEASEGASKDAVVKTVSRRTRLRRGERERLSEQKEKISWRETDQQRLL